MRKLKMLLSTAALALAFALLAPAALYANEVSATIDGVAVDFADQAPIIEDGRTLVPLRGVFEALGFDVNWEPDTQTVTLTATRYELTDWYRPELSFAVEEVEVEVIVTIGSETFTANGEVFELDVPARLLGGRTLVPIRHILESVGHFVDWDEATSTVIVRNLWSSLDLVYRPGALERQIAPPAEGDLAAVIHTNMGEIRLRLFPDLAPLAVENFVTHAQAGYYDGVIFHRVFDGFMIQGGDPLGTGMGGESIWDMPFGDERTVNLRHIRGALSMANAGPSTNGSQFFIVQIDTLQPAMAGRLPVEETLAPRLALQNEIFEPLGIPYSDIFPAAFLEHYIEFGGVPHLDFWHTVFGQVYIGMDVVDAIARVDIDEETWQPLEDIVIETIEILR